MAANDENKFLNLRGLKTLKTELDNRYVNVTGDTMTGTLTINRGNQTGIKIGTCYLTNCDGGGEVILQGGHLRFGESAWDYDQWAGLKYTHSNKTISLGIANKSAFTANSNQTGGTIQFPGIANLKIDTNADDTGIFFKYSNKNYNVLRSHNNGNVSLNSCSGGLYIGYENTSLIDFFSGKAGITGSGYYKGVGYQKSGSNNDYALLGGGSHRLVSEGVTGSSIVCRNKDGYVYANYINTNISNEDGISALSSFYVENDNDKWIRKISFNKTKEWLTYRKVIFTVEGDKDTFYPVTFDMSHNKNYPMLLTIWKNLGSKTPAIAGNHSNGTSSMMAQYEGRSVSWDGNNGYIKSHYIDYGYAPLLARADSDGGPGGHLILWLRGGGCEYNASSTWLDFSSTNIKIYYNKQSNTTGSSNYPCLVDPISLSEYGNYNHGYYAYNTSLIPPHNHDDRYVNITGDTMTGDLHGLGYFGNRLHIVNNSSDNSDDAVFYIQNRSTSDWAQKIDITDANYGLRITGPSNASQAVLIDGVVNINAHRSDWGEGIRLNADSNQWVTIRMGGVNDVDGTGENIWSIHRTSSNDFSISRNSSDGINGLFMGKNGRMGLGTTTPEYRLQVAGDIYANGWLRTSGQVGWYNQTYGGGIYMSDSSWVRVYNGKGFYVPSTMQAAGGLVSNHGHNLMTAGNEFNFIEDEYNNTVWFNYDTHNRKSNGNVSAYEMGNGKHGHASVKASNFYADSDKRLKTNINNSTITNYYNILNNINLYEFEWINKETYNGINFGTIAQELEMLLPEHLKRFFVNEDNSENHYLSINDGKLVYLTIGALQEQLKINEELKNKNNELEERLAKLEKILGVA